MKTYLNLEESIVAFEEYMQQLENDKEYCMNLYAHMRQCFDENLANGTYASLFELLPYFEDPDAYPMFHPSSETKMIFVLLNTLKLELKYGKQPFIQTVHSYAELQEQYALTVFALRRLELALSEDSMNEACSYLRSLPLNVYAAGLIITNEYFENYKRLYRSLYQCMQDIWTSQDKIYWLLSLSKYDSSEEIMLELASAYMESNDYSGAYQVLLQITNPSAETISIISSLKELFQNE